MRKFCNRFSRSKLLEILERENWNKVLSYALAVLEYDEDILKCISIVLDKNDPVCRRAISTNVNLFYRQINELVSDGILIKIKPKTYIVRMDYLCVMSDAQKRAFRKGEYDSILPLELIEFFNK